LEDVGVDGRIILKFILREKCEIEIIHLAQDTVQWWILSTDSLEGREFLVWLSAYKFLKRTLPHDFDYLWFLQSKFVDMSLFFVVLQAWRSNIIKA
jgi:hypothetical protein